ncbi:MAG TPA: YdcF family protein [Xanthobacteraceae bacterium]|nr:YdcF family protein [Xanthobacteraceae bacterium]
MSPPASPPPAGAARRRRFAWPLRLLLGLPLLAGLALFVGFLIFAADIAPRKPNLQRSADGIVVLTGGADRIEEATDLLVAKHGRRLLITGVHPDTTLQEIAQTVPASQAQLECCVDIGRSALNTRGNAIETARWARARQFHSLIVVTSAWHMPRALMELARAVPEMDLVPYPVVSDRLRSTPWWQSPATARLIFIEYLKFLLASAQIRTSPAVAPEGAPPAP